MPCVVAYEVIAVLLTVVDDTWGVLAHSAADTPQPVGSAMPVLAGEDRRFFVHNRVAVGVVAVEVRQRLPYLPAAKVHRPLYTTIAFFRTVAGATVVVHDTLEPLVDSTAGVV